MPLRDILELGTLVSLHGPNLIQASERLPERSLIGYWSASKSRLDNWARALKSFSVEVSSVKEGVSSIAWRQVRPTLEEILVSELLTRVWSAVACLHDQQQTSSDAEPVTRSVLVGHLEARHRALQLVVAGRGISSDQAVRINRLRRRVESWTDLLIGHLARRYAAAEFAFEPERAREFARDRAHYSSEREALEWHLTVAAMRTAFGKLSLDPTPNATFNSRIAASILMSFRPECFDSTGLFKGLWLEHLCHQAINSQGLIEELLSLDYGTYRGN